MASSVVFFMTKRSELVIMILDVITYLLEGYQFPGTVLTSTFCKNDISLAQALDVANTQHFWCDERSDRNVMGRCETGI